MLNCQVNEGETIFDNYITIKYNRCKVGKPEINIKCSRIVTKYTIQSSNKRVRLHC